MIKINNLKVKKGTFLEISVQVDGWWHQGDESFHIYSLDRNVPDILESPLGLK